MARNVSRIALVMTLGMSACGVTVWDAANQYGPPYCQKLQGWFPDSFELTYPGGIPQCEQQWTPGYSNQDLGQSSGCSRAQLDNCVSAVNNLKEGLTLDGTPLPAACDVCAGPTLPASGASDGG